MKWDGENNVEHMREHVKREIVESASVWLSESRKREPKECEECVVELQLREIRLPGRKCWELKMKIQKKDV